MIIPPMEANHVEMEDGNNFFFHTSNTSDYFDRVIGNIEDIVMEEEFQILQKDFFERNWEKVEDTEENKLEYMEIFNEYTEITESFIVNKLCERMDDFDMDKFMKELQSNKSSLEGEIFELLLSLTDFLSFKELILDYRADKEGKYPNINSGITVTRIPDEDDSEE